MNRDTRLLERRKKWIGMYMKQRKLDHNYDYQTAISDAASMFSIKKRTAVKDFTQFNKRKLVTSTHVQYELPF
tara:strand:+ start:238 stop:456 length:219 start_codon:yes stop_codon:yes gene_type:complete